MHIDYQLGNLERKYNRTEGEHFDMKNDNTTPMSAGVYDQEINNTIPYYSEFYDQTFDVIEQCNYYNGGFRWRKRRENK